MKVRPIKPCPFCGHKAVAMKGDENETFIVCKNSKCKAVTLFYKAEYTTTLERWNRREGNKCIKSVSE